MTLNLKSFLPEMTGKVTTLRSSPEAVNDAFSTYIGANTQPILLGLAVLMGILALKSIAAGGAMLVSFMMANWPLLLIIGIITGVIAGLHSMGHSFEEIFGIIGGVVGVAVAGIVNIFIDLWNFMAGFVNAFARIFDDPIAGIVGLFVEAFSFILNTLSHAARVIDIIFGSGISEAIAGFNNQIQGWYDSSFGKTEEFMGKMGYVDANDWAARGEEMGRGFGAFLDNPTFSLAEVIDFDPFGGRGDGSAVEGLLSNIDKNTAGQLDYSEEQLRLWRDIAERDTINRFTTAEVKLEFNGGINNNVSSNMDLDGMIDYIAESLEETLSSLAEGVHA